MPDSLQSIDKRCCFRETFESELAVRRNGGIPTNVTFSKGVATFNGTSSLIRYPNISRGTYSIRIVLSRLVIDTKYLYDFSERGNLGYGWCHITTGTGAIAIANGTIYVNGVASGVATSETKEIIIAGTSVNCNLANWVIGNSYYQGYPINMDISLFEIYTGTLTADEVKNLYENKRYAISDCVHTEQLSTELILNGGFDINADWALYGTGSTIHDGRAYLASSTGYIAYIGQGNRGFGLPGKTYYVTADVYDLVGQCWMDNNYQGRYLSEGHNEFYIYFAGPSYQDVIYFFAITYGSSFSLDNVSAKEVLIPSVKEILNVSALNGVITNRYSGEAYIELCTNAGTGDQTDWIDSNSDGLADDWVCISEGSYPQIKTIVSGNGFIGNAQRVQENNDIDYAIIVPTSISTLKVGSQYKITGKYRSSAPLSVHKSSGPQYSPGQGNLGPTNTGNAASFDFTFTATELYWYICAIGTNAWFELDEVSIKEIIPSPVLTDVQVVKENDIYAIKFNGTTSKIDCGSYDPLVGDKTFIEWIKIKTYGQTTYGGFIIYGGNLIIFTRADNKSLNLTSDNSTWRDSLFGSITLNKWICLTQTRKSNGITNFYIDGVISGAANQDGGVPVNSTFITIGGPSSNTNGLISSIRILDGILSSQEISYIYSSEKHLYGL